MITRFAITVGAGRKRPQGKLRSVADAPSIAVLHEALEQLPADVEGWWSLHQWDGWRSAGGTEDGVDGNLDDWDEGSVPTP